MSRSFLMVLPKEIAVGADALVEHQFDLAAARHVEAGADLAQHAQDLVRRIGLHGIEDLGQRQVAPQHLVALRDDVEIDDEAGGFRPAIGEETCDSFVHAWGPSHARRGQPTSIRGVVRPRGVRRGMRAWRATDPPVVPAVRRGAAEKLAGASTGRSRLDGHVAQFGLLGSTEARRPLPRATLISLYLASIQGAAALRRIATISTSLSGPAHDDRLCQKGRATSLHNHDGP